MRPQKIISINIVDENEDNIICPKTGREVAVHLDEQDYELLLSSAKSKYQKGLTDRQYMEKVLNTSFKEQLKK